MLDIRATHYVSPLAEVEFESIPLTVHLTNVADETGLITGKFRVYDDTTGLLIFTSEIAPLTIAAGASADVSALTEFDPAAPADDTYFVIFDGNASNALVPDGIGIHLGAFYFDVKPVGMGPAPATHHLTHEEGGADMIEVGDMGTAELDDTLVLQPDGAGGVEWAAAPGGVTDHGALTGLADDDHTQYRLRSQLYYENDCLYTLLAPWTYTLLASGIIGISHDGINHPGILQVLSSTSANSGVCVHFSNEFLLIGGGEEAEFIFKPEALANLEIWAGFRDTTNIGDSVDGVYISVSQVGGVNGVLRGKTASNSNISTTATSYTITTLTWYRLIIQVNAAASRVDFYLYSAAGALLWTDNLTTNIPTGAGRSTGHNFAIASIGTVSQMIGYLDYIRITITRALTR